ncbi:restriction endonuclease subunit S [Cryobacterium sp. N22]|uniref:restriction endonuclease subunit S n=1 Tax=Cryobacterium sp. N22 TaxID=2048290 RepID=UPI000CE36CA3|nr:restriction endonuclease subunit S [Cryobacterium sp. N22]
MSVRIGSILGDLKPGYATSDDLADGVFQIRMNNVTRDGHLDLTKKRRVLATDRQRQQQSLRVGDVIFNATNSPELVGKSALIRHLDEPTVFSNHFFRLRVDPQQMHPDYLSNFLRFEFSRGTFRGLARQWVSQAAVSRESLESVVIRVPPLPEQRRIAAILDQADDLRSKRRRALALLDELADSAFAELHAHSAGVVSIRTLEELGTWKTGGTPSRKSPEYFSGPIPWATSGELNSMFINKTKEHISDTAVRESSVKLVPQGALMLGMYDTAALKSAIASIPMACNQAIAFGVLDPKKALPEYVYFAVQGQRQEVLLLQRGIRQKNLNLGIIKGISIRVPDIEVQRRFVAFIAQVNSWRLTCQSEIGRIDELFASLQHRAFRGEL